MKKYVHPKVVVFLVRSLTILSFVPYGFHITGEYKFYEHDVKIEMSRDRLC